MVVISFHTDGTSFAKMKTEFESVVPDQFLFSIVPRMIKYYAIFCTWLAYGRHYDSSIDPFEIIEINPNRVNEVLWPEGKRCFQHPDYVSEVVDGSWYRHSSNLEEYDLTKSLSERFISGVSWDQTDFYQRMKKHYESGGDVKWECENFDQFENRLSELDELYKNMKEHGYLRQRELREIDETPPASQRIHHYWPPELLEVTVNILPEGKFMLHDGRHRLTIAQCLELSTIPVRVKTRHKKWQQIREEIYSGDKKPTKFKNHPDITVPNA